MFWNPQDLLFMMGTEIFKINASWAEKLMKARVSSLTAPTVDISRLKDWKVIFVLIWNILCFKKHCWWTVWLIFHYFCKAFLKSVSTFYSVLHFFELCNNIRVLDPGDKRWWYRVLCSGKHKQLIVKSGIKMRIWIKNKIWYLSLESSSRDFSKVFMELVNFVM